MTAFQCLRADVRARRRVDRGCREPCQLSSSSNCLWLACAEGDDAPDGIVRRNADRDPVAGDYLDSEAAHSTAKLGEHFVSCVALHAVQSTAVHRDHGALHINEIILAQLLARPFVQTNIVPQGRAGTQRNRQRQCPSTRYQP